MTEKKLLFQPWQAVIEPAFWARLGDLKLNELGLEETPLSVTATYKSSNHPQIPGALSIGPTSLSPDDGAAQTAADSCAVRGDLYCLNTIEGLVTFDRQAAVESVADAIWGDIVSGEAERRPSLLQRLVALVYCDLKRYRYHHWMAFPVLAPPAPFALHQEPRPLAAHFSSSPAVLQAATVALEAWMSRSGSGPAAPSPLFLLSSSRRGEVKEGIQCHELAEWGLLSADENTKIAVDGSFFLYLVVVDPSNAEEHPGWPLRNALLMAAVRWKVPLLRVLCIRTRRGRVDAHASVFFEAALPEIPPEFHPKTLSGWDLGAGGKLGPRVADLAPTMDPRRLAASAVDLNLKLMRWRAAPSLDVASVSAARCLLLGAGTLGCSVARCLLGWGVRKITFVDNSKVAFSNPVRQSLYTFDDCLEGGKPKAEAAAAAVRQIFPDVDAVGVDLTIPMPGHPPAPTEVAATAQHAAQLEELVRSHDVTFLLLDTREARWLPTLLCAAASKLAITAALGFDSFVVMRHGEGPKLAAEASASSLAPSTSGVPSVPEGEALEEEDAAVAMQGEDAPDLTRLGCYFCSDVVAPANSTRDRTLDQQCTVARPGLSGVAGALAGEVMAATLTHLLGVAAPAAESSSADEFLPGAPEEEPPALGQVPHMIRGNFTGFSQTCMYGRAFPQCPACSATVVKEFNKKGVDFVLEAVSQPHYLEDLTGLTELHRAAKEAAEAAEEDQAARRATGSKGGGEEDEWEEL